MSLEGWAEKMLDGSFFARAVRKSTAKSVVLGWMDAIQNPNAVLSEIAGREADAEEPAEKPRPPIPSKANQPVALPRPMLLAVPGPDAADEPDRPGVPPKKVRKQKKAPPPSPAVEAEVQSSPTSPSEEAP
jgi:hypothetical protein